MNKTTLFLIFCVMCCELLGMGLLWCSRWPKASAICLFIASLPWLHLSVCGSGAHIADFVLCCGVGFLWESSSSGIGHIVTRNDGFARRWQHVRKMRWCVPLAAEKPHGACMWSAGPVLFVLSIWQVNDWPNVGEISRLPFPPSC